jgi:hypothetical protein
MDAFWIWNPWVASTDPPAVELFVTLGEAFELDAGTPALMAELLSEVGVEGDPVRWRFERYRTGYFTDYPDSPDWEDRWPHAWRATIELASVPDYLAASREVGVDSVDESWRSASDPAKAPSSRCLILADFPDEAALDRAHEATARLAPSAVLRRALAVGAFPQLQIDLGDRPREFYAAGAGEAQALLDECGRLGGSLRFTQTQVWLRRRSSAASS